ncbi:membrane protease subunit HflC [Salsuginibacillus halophilus]|uniref:Protein HflC n=1 Tax=Salsuginibacillus halophilus TaxID=517424 RepID=A0A2P8HCV4_9BACI|nr:protease modulator HflC [Salsuginibacillus halophilus]PSL44067.1 membrane protease subunit HflC [Salsuginibacillus halophilus]
MSDENVVNFNGNQEQRPWWKEPVWLRTLVILGVLIAGIVVVIANLFVVEQDEYKVVRQFGEVVRIEEDPGLNIKVPFVQSVEAVPRHQLNYDAPTTEINTRDKKRVLVDNYVVWYVSNPALMIANARSVENSESIMANFMNSVLRSELGQMDYDEIINEEESSRGDFNENLQTAVNELLDENDYGVSVADIRVKRTDLPEDNERAVYDRMVSEREATAQDYLSEGEAEANRIRANADQEAQELLAEAEADAEEIRAEGEADAAEVYNDSFGQDPEFAQLYQTLQTYETTIDDETVIVLPADAPYARILMGYLD